MPQPILKLSCSLLGCLLATILFAQVASDTDSIKVKPKKPDSLKVKFYPRSLRLGTDVIALINSRTQKKVTGWELNGDVDCGKYYFAVDYGSSGKQFDLSTGGTYQNDGTYWRVGWDVNLLRKDPDRNMFFIGFRYARSSFSESATIAVSDPYFGSIQKQVSNPNVKAAWGELTVGIRVKIWKEFWMGYTARMKFPANLKGDEALTTYEIPGFGLNGQGVYWGFNYQIFWRIPFAKQKKPVSKTS